MISVKKYYQIAALWLAIIVLSSLHESPIFSWIGLVLFLPYLFSKRIEVEGLTLFSVKTKWEKEKVFFLEPGVYYTWPRVVSIIWSKEWLSFDGDGISTRSNGTEVKYYFSASLRNRTSLSVFLVSGMETVKTGNEIPFPAVYLEQKLFDKQVELELLIRRQIEDFLNDTGKNLEESLSYSSFIVASEGLTSTEIWYSFCFQEISI